MTNLTTQTNKVVNVTLSGGIIGLLADSPQISLNAKIEDENAKGWKVIQVIPADSGNLFLSIFRFLLLVCTIFLYTTANGYYVILERTQPRDIDDTFSKSEEDLICSSCGKIYSSRLKDSFCEECGNQL